MIPHVIHRSGPLSYNSMTKRCPEITDLFQSILHRNPGYELRYWSDDASNVFFLNTFGTCDHDKPDCDCKRVYRAYNRLLPGAFRADMLRYALMYTYGGIWNDLTQDFFVPLASMVDHDKDKLVLVRDMTHGNCSMHRGVQISFMACEPRLPIMKAIMMQVVANVEAESYGSCALALTGPVCASIVIAREDDIEFRCEMCQDSDNIISSLVNTSVKNGKVRRSPNILCRSEYHNKCLPTRKSTPYTTLWSERAAIAPEDHTHAITDIYATPEVITADDSYAHTKNNKPKLPKDALDQ